MPGSISISTVLIFIFIIIVNNAVTTGAAAASPVKAAYWPSWALDFPPSAIDTAHFTHVYYAFLLPSNVTFKFEISNLTAIFLANFVSTLRQKSPRVKTLYSVGGAAVADPNLFANLASDPERRRAFVESAIGVGREYGFDGIDFDWEFPKSQEEMGNLGILLEEWRRAIDEEARATGRHKLLLTAAVYFSPDVNIDGVRRSYDVGLLGRSLDWASPMCFDYHGGWEPKRTGAHAALFDPSGNNLSTSHGLQSWIGRGMPRSKVVMGLPLYGRSWELEEAYRNSGVGAPAVGVGLGDDAQIKYRHVVALIKEYGATVAYDVATVSTYAVLGTAWIGYDDDVTITAKIGFAQALGIRGYFFWDVSGDHEWTVAEQAAKAWVHK